MDWSTKDIQVKNVFSGGATENGKNFGPIISLIVKSIKERKAIIYDNVREGVFEYRNVSVFPVKIEFSIVNVASLLSFIHRTLKKMERRASS